MLEPNEVITLIARYYNVSVSDMLSKSRKDIYVTPRHVLIYILKRDFTITDKNIGSFVNRARGTIHSAITKMDNLSSYDKNLNMDLSKIRMFIKNPYLLSKNKKIRLKEPYKSYVIYQYDSDMNKLNEFTSIKEASDKTGVSISTISRAIFDYKRLGKGFYWIKKLIKDA